MKVGTAHLQADLSRAHSLTQDAANQLEHQKEITDKALRASQSSAELSALVSEMARFRFFVCE